jgi:5'-deoxy-5'-methylthioadenosine phosphorylase
MSDVIGIIGGSGFDGALHGDFVGEHIADTPYGDCSAPLQVYRSQTRQLIVLQRHGIPHRIPPHRINYRANVWALHRQGCRKIVAINTVGGISANAVAGAIILPDQIIDYTYGREHTFSDDANCALQHIDFTEPYSSALREELRAAAARVAVPLISAAVYGATQGPRLEAAAEIARMQRDGCDIVGMTGMPEAALARELGLDYAALCLVVNPAAGKGGAISIEAMQRVSAQGMHAIVKIIAGLLAD